MVKVKTSVPYSLPENISADSIRNQLQRILASPEFTATESQQKILQFVVSETLSGNSDKIKGFTVATCVFGRGDDFDQGSDPIVSIHANKLRQSLERYYLVAGHSDQVYIDIPKGTYIPVFTKQSPDSQFARAILAFVRLLTNEISAAKEEAQLAYELHSNSVVLLDLIGYVMAPSGDWEQGTELIKKAIRRNPFHADYAHYALWGNWIRQKDYEQAYQETMHLRSPQNFWEPLVKASTLGNLGRLEEGRKSIEDLLTLKPDFPSRGRILIGRFVKSKSIAESTADGLKKCGLELA